MTEGKPCSTCANCHMTKHVTFKGPKSCLKMKSCLCHISKSVFITSFTSEKYILQLKNTIL